MLRADANDVRIAIASLVAALAATLAPVAATAASGSAVPRQTKQRAERNLLAARRMLSRWRVGLVDPKTGLLRSNTTASCTGRGRAVGGRYAQFTCVLRYHRITVRLVYVSLARNGFEVRRLR